MGHGLAVPTSLNLRRAKARSGIHAAARAGHKVIASQVYRDTLLNCTVRLDYRADGMAEGRRMRDNKFLFSRPSRECNI